jgi:hypothetical protein
VCAAVTVTLSMILAYVTLPPLCIFVLLKYRSPTQRSTYSLMQLVCLYGYVLTAFIPISVGRD